MLKIHYILPDENAYTNIEILFQDILRKAPCVCGLDTETTVLMDSSIISSSIKTSIMQVCMEINYNINTINSNNDLETVYDDPKIYTSFIFHLQSTYNQKKVLPQSLVKFLENRNIIKVGADITLDSKKIKKDYNIKIKGIIDIQDLSRSIGDLDYSLGNLAEKYLHLHKLKSNLGNYDSILTLNQIEYAAYDAYLSLMLYKKMTKPNPMEIHPYFYIDRESINVDIDHAKEFLTFLKTTSLFNTDGSIVTYDKILNVTFNGYTPWRNNTKLCNAKISIALKLLIKHGLMISVNAGLTLPNGKEFDKFDDKNKSSIINDENKIDDVFYNRIMSLTKKCIGINGIKYESLINVLYNSIFSKNVNNNDNNDNKKLIILAIETMLSNNVIVKSSINRLFIQS